MYPWPIADADLVLQEALDIAMDYLEFTGQAYPFSATQRFCAQTILRAWRAGRTHRIRLANDAINGIEKGQTSSVENIESLYPRVS
jgi:hypothetical protein